MYNLQWISLFLTWQLTFSALIRVVGKFDTSCVEKHGIQQRRPSIPISPCEIDSRGARGENSKMVLIPKKKKKKKRKTRGRRTEDPFIHVSIFELRGNLNLWKLRQISQSFSTCRITCCFTYSQWDSKASTYLARNLSQICEMWRI